MAIKKEFCLKLADKLDTLLPHQFDMGNWEKCICGWAGKMSGIQSTEQIVKLLATGDGEELAVRHALFTGKYCLPREAAKVVRHFAKTGFVDWTKAAAYSSKKAIAAEIAAEIVC